MEFTMDYRQELVQIKVMDGDDFLSSRLLYGLPVVIEESQIAREQIQLNCTALLYNPF